MAEPDQRLAQADPQRPPRPPERAQLFRAARRVREPLLGQPQCNLLMEIHRTALSYRPAAGAKVSVCNRTDDPGLPARRPSGAMLRTIR